MIAKFNDRRTSSALRQLAKDIDDGEYRDFVFITWNEEGDIQQACKADDAPYTLIGIMSSTIMDIRDDFIE